MSQALFSIANLAELKTVEDLMLGRYYSGGTNPFATIFLDYCDQATGELEAVVNRPGEYLNNFKVVRVHRFEKPDSELRRVGRQVADKVREQLRKKLLAQHNQGPGSSERDDELPQVRVIRPPEHGDPGMGST